MYLVVIWIVFLVDIWLELDLNSNGLRPRETGGLKGIITMHFLHGDLNHIVNNSTALAVLLWGLFYFYRRIAFQAMVIMMLTMGVYLWLFGEAGNHIGASGLIYGLAAFLTLGGFIRGSKELLGMSMLVIFMYGGMIWWVLPIDPAISWQGHLFGAIAGISMAIYYRKRGPRKKRYQWEHDEEQEAMDAIREIEMQPQHPMQWPNSALPPVNYVYTYVPKNRPTTNEEESETNPPSEKE